MKNRLGIFLFYDEQGVVDDYVPYFLKALKEHVRELCVVVNGDLNSTNRKKLEDVCDKYIERENIHYDSGAYKHVIETYGYNYLSDLDELIICNYTFYGPIYPLFEMFDAMDKRDCDFWGIHRFPAVPEKCGDYSVPEHIQSHFMVFRKKILSSPKFKEYWDTLKPATNYYEAVGEHELKCTKYFESFGFKSDTYLDKNKYFQDYYYYNFTNGVFHQIIQDRCPIIKRKFFYLNKKNKFEWTKAQKHVPLVLKYLKKNTNYDTNLILQNMIRSQYSTMKSFNHRCMRKFIGKNNQIENIFGYLWYSLKFNFAKKHSEEYKLCWQKKEIYKELIKLK